MGNTNAHEYARLGNSMLWPLQMEIKRNHNVIHEKNWVRFYTIVIIIS